jgi:uncharacterized protein YutE (UPF0331/DUF86 family)
MTALDKEILVERIQAVERHLKRVRDNLPASESEFIPASNASDAVILHLWQAIQLTIDTALSSCVHLNLGSPVSYADSFLRLAKAGVLEQELAVRLSHAAGFRNRLVHSYEDLDLQKIYKIAQTGSRDLLAFFAAVVKSI